jgi:hypothetical protein
MPKPSDETPTTPMISSWMSASLTLYPRYGAPRKLSFPCTLETQLLLQRLEQEQQGREKTNRRERVARRSPEAQSGRDKK